MSKCLTHDCPNEGVIAIAIAKRGGRNGFLCRSCAERERGYSHENSIRYGKRKENRFTFSTENEVSYSTLKARAELLDFGFVPTSDCTVDVEYKSPIYEGLPALSKQCVSIGRLIAEGEMRIGSECGTHLHVGHAEHINGRTMRYLRRFNGSLFTPLSDVIMADAEKSARFFGRCPNEWAEPVSFEDPSGNYDGCRMKHSAMFNLQHDYTIEFRQAKFVDAEQYMQVVRFGKEFTNIVIENFIKHFNDTPTDTRRYPTKTSYRKHKADVTAEKLVKLYKKYTANL